MTNDWSWEEGGESPDLPSTSAESAPAEPKAEDTATAPLTVPAALVPTPPMRSTRPFRIWSPHDPDLTEERRYDIENQMSAGYWLHKALEEENRVAMPEELRERSVIVKLLLQESLVLLAIALLGWALVSAGLNGWVNLGLGLAIVASIITGAYIWKVWTVTFHVVTASKTGIERQPAWIFISQHEPELSTKDIIISRQYQPGIFTTLHIPWWRVFLETAAQEESQKVKKLRFVRHGDRFVERIGEFKLALK